MHDDEHKATQLKSFAPIIAAAILAVGLMGAGYIVSTHMGAGFGNAFAKGKMAARIVSVKGLAEREVKADVALWEIKVVSTSNDLSADLKKVEADLGAIKEFLVKGGIAEESVTPQRVEVLDLMAQQYRPEGAAQSRYIVRSSVLVSSDKVDTVAELSRQIGSLIRDKGVIFNADAGFTGPYFIFTKLNDVKLDMIAEATKNARAAAEQFARDSGVRVGNMYRADQGQFSIQPRDDWSGAVEEQQIHKKVRVVSTVDYLLGDE